jgi:hypothetical protein
MKVAFLLRRGSRPLGLVRLAIATAMLLVCGGAMPARAQTATINEVGNWNRIAVTTLIAFPPPAGGAAPALQINLAMVQGAVYDAINAIEPRHTPYLLDTRFAPTASKDAAAASAAFRVLSYIVESVPQRVPFPNRTELLEELTTDYGTSLAAVPNGPAKTEGIAAGEAAALAIIGAREGDGRFGPSSWTPNNGLGNWQPLLRRLGSPTCDRS